MFNNSQFNGNLSNWVLRSGADIANLFNGTQFNNDSLANWNVENVVNLNYMFAYSPFNGDISKWNVSNVKKMVTCSIIHSLM